MVDESLLDFYKRRSQVATRVKNAIQREKKAAYDAKRCKRCRELIRQQSSDYYQKNKAQILERRKYEKTMSINSNSSLSTNAKKKTHARNSSKTKITMKDMEFMKDYYKRMPRYRSSRNIPLDLHEQIVITIADMVRDQWCERILMSVIEANKEWLDNISSSSMQSEIDSYITDCFRNNYGICSSTWTKEYYIEYQQLVKEQGEKLPLLNEKINAFLSNLLMKKIDEMDNFFKTSSGLEPAVCDILLYIYLMRNEVAIKLRGFNNASYNFVLKKVQERIPDDKTWKFDQRIYRDSTLCKGLGYERLTFPDSFDDYHTKPPFDKHRYLVPTRPWHPTKSEYKNFGKSVTLRKHSFDIKDNYTKEITTIHN
jgi:hypothetical protein